MGRWGDGAIARSKKKYDNYSTGHDIRQCFAKVAVKVDELKDIIWVNPAKIEEKPLARLQTGAEPEIERSLGFQKADN